MSWTLRSTGLGLHFEPSIALRDILFLPAATGTARATWDNMFAGHEDLFEDANTAVFVYDPVFTTGFYARGQDIDRLKLLLNMAANRGKGVVIAGGSMGGYGAVTIYTRLQPGSSKERIVHGIYSVSPPINLVSSYNYALNSQDPVLVDIAADMLQSVGHGTMDGLVSRSLINYFPDIPTRMYVSITIGSEDNLIGTKTDREELKRYMTSQCEFNGVFMEVQGGGHDNSVWCLENMVSFARALI